ncbi:cytidylyltransferase domain-containing protein [Maribacter antarcticus]|uniref:cytidylyltransferase domain-containing protein n=1 Tax=Maribacter antarcticus TaxID=505250 RepID=UPI00146F97FC|nr:hypothetical protein [Maribacter antarcticus]
MKIGAVIQARYDSTRLPGKVLMNLPFNENKTILNQIVNRLQKVKLIDEIIIATSNNPKDAVIETFAREQRIKCIRGDENNVLKRFVQVIKEENLDVVIRITGDNPVVLIDILEKALQQHLKSNFDYTRNLNLPYGTSFEIVNANVLEKVSQEPDLSESDKEHVTIYIKNNRKTFSILELDHKVNYSDFRFTVDYPSDYGAMNIIYQYLSTLDYNYNLKTLLEFLEDNSWIQGINNSNLQKKQGNNLEEELEIAVGVLGSLELNRVVLFLKDKLG